MMEIEHFAWEKKGGKWFGKDNGLGVLVMVKWACFVVGFEVLPTGVVLFLGPLAIGVGKPAIREAEDEQD